MDALTRQARRGIVKGEKEEKSAFLTYLLSQKSLTPEEANSHALDLLMGAVETVGKVSKLTEFIARFYLNVNYVYSDTPERTFGYYQCI